MQIKIIFIDGSVWLQGVSNKKEAESIKPALDATVQSAVLVKGNQVLNYLKK